MKLFSLLYGIFLVAAGLAFQQQTNQMPLQTYQEPRAYTLYHNNHYVEKWKPEYRKMVYYTIDGEGAQKRLKKVKVNFKTVDDECVGQRITYFNIDGNDNPELPLLVAPGINEKTPLLNALYQDNKLSEPSDKIEMTFDGGKQTLALKKNRDPKDSLDLYLLHENVQIQVCKTNLDPDYPVKLIYAGDLSGDKKMDLILQVNKSNGIYWILFISADQTGTPELKQADRCLFTSLPC
jgi:hypothetical protein